MGGAAFLLLGTAKPRSAGFWMGVFFALIAIALVVSLGTPDRTLARAW